MLPLRGSIDMGVDQRNHPVAPVFPSGWFASEIFMGSACSLRSFGFGLWALSFIVQGSRVKVIRGDEVVTGA